MGKGESQIGLARDALNLELKMSLRNSFYCLGQSASSRWRRWSESLWLHDKQANRFDIRAQVEVRHSPPHVHRNVGLVSCLHFHENGRCIMSHTIGGDCTDAIA